MPASALVPIAGLSARDLDAWRALASRSSEPNPFWEPGMLLAAVGALGHPHGLLVARDGERWTACAPVVFERLTLPGRTRALPLAALRGWRHDHCYLGVPLVDGGDVEGGVAGLRTSARNAGARVVRFDLVDPDGPVGRAFALAGGARVLEDDRAALHRRETPDYLDARLSAHHRRDLARLRRKLARDLGVEGVEVVDRAGDAEAVRAFLVLEREGWKGRQGTALAVGGGAAFLERACQDLAEAGRLELLALQAGERVAAMKLNVRAAEGVFCFKIAFDESLARYSPGIQLEMATVDRFHQRGVEAWMDSCADPANSMINRLWPDRRTMASYLVPTSVRGRTLTAAVRGARWARHRIRKERDARAA